MGLPIKIETRTGDTPVSRRQRQRRYPPDILLTTPEQLALLLSSDDAPFLFSSLKQIVLDELHALVTSKRGDLLSLGLARLWRLAPEMRAIGLSATVAEPESLARFLVPQPPDKSKSADIVVAGGAAAPVVEMLDTRERLPWAGHSARHALGEIYDLIKSCARMVSGHLQSGLGVLLLAGRLFQLLSPVLLDTFSLRLCLVDWKEFARRRAESAS